MLASRTQTRIFSPQKALQISQRSTGTQTEFTCFQLLRTAFRSGIIYFTLATSVPNE
jgi:hypothetical protein